MPVYALLYASSPHPDLSASDLADIRRASAERNGLRNVTGLLLHSGGGFGADGTPRPAGFVQWLEGERETVRDLYAHIQADRRHSGTRLIVEGHHLYASSSGDRLFPGWGLRVHPVNRLPDTLEGFLAFVGRERLHEAPAVFID